MLLFETVFFAMVKSSYLADLKYPLIAELICVIIFATGILIPNADTYNYISVKIMVFISWCAKVFTMAIVLITAFACILSNESMMSVDSEIIIAIVVMLLISFGRLYLAQHICGWEVYEHSKSKEQEYDYNDVEESKRLKYMQNDPHLDTDQQWRFKK